MQLLKPAGLDFWQGFGLRLDRGDLGRLVCIIFAVVAAALWGEWVLGQAAEYLQLENHWTEWFDQDLVWGDSAHARHQLAGVRDSRADFEEIVFRGFSLRCSVGGSVLPAALLSATIFALARMATVCWDSSASFGVGSSGLGSTNRTGSLIPGMVAHAVNSTGLPYRDGVASL
ncbi:MAG: CPBP family intramembrane metalloprotease [Nitrospira sp.]|nr:CPBP family intramembrane metalloprotease [Nitrospira sp.]